MDSIDNEISATVSPAKRPEFPKNIEVVRELSTAEDDTPGRYDDEELTHSEVREAREYAETLPGYCEYIRGENTHLY